MVKRAIAGGILAGLVLFALFQAVTKEPAPAAVTATKISEGAAIDSSAPEFTLKNLNGEEVSLKDYKGKKVMLNFWATWCPPCKAEMPAMQQLYSQKPADLEILAINLDPQNDVSGFVNSNGLDFPVLLDQSGSTQQLYSIISIPTTFLIDEKGVIKKKHIGSMTFEQMEEIID